MNNKIYENIFFDCEVLKNDWIVVFYNEQKNEYKTIINDRRRLIDYIERNKSKAIFYGWNNNFYDNYVIQGIYQDENPVKINDIINKKTEWNKLPRNYKLKIEDWITCDVMSELSNFFSLKECQGYLGDDIVFSEVDFDKQERLNEKEIEKLVNYCKNDVLSLFKIKNITQQKTFSIQAKINLLEEFNIPLSKGLCLTNSKIAEIILDAKKIKDYQYNYNYKCPSKLNIENKNIISNYETHNFVDPENETERFCFKVKSSKNKMETTFGVGGIHGALKKYKNTYDSLNQTLLYLIDVNSLYPNLMVNEKNPELNFCSKGIKKDILLKIIKKRLQYKAKKNPLEKSYKLIINSVYGSMLNQYLALYDWKRGRDVCITGQLILWELLEQCEKLISSNILQINTDGLFLEINQKEVEKLNNVLSQWENKWGLTLDKNIINNGKIFQRDVNNYVIIKDNKIFKTKGKDLKEENNVTSLFSNHRIVGKALINYIAYNIPITKTIYDAFERNNIIDFQIILNKKANSYENNYWGDMVVDKIVRVFATNNKNLPTITKMKNGVKHNYPDNPEHCFLYQQNIKNLDLKKINLDLNYYINLAKKRVEKFLGE